MKTELLSLKQQFLFRQVLNKQFNHYTEVETNIMIAIYLMNSERERCSGNTLSTYLSEIHRTPTKKNLLATIRKLTAEEVITVTGRGAAVKIDLRQKGKAYLIRLEAYLIKVAA